MLRNRGPKGQEQTYQVCHNPVVCLARNQPHLGRRHHLPAPSDTIYLRLQVMGPNGPKHHVHVPGDADALHSGALDGNTLVGVRSFFVDGTAKSSSVRLRKLATEPAYQGRGVASQLIKTARQHLIERVCTELWCDARLSATPFYDCNGFELEQSVFRKNGLDYVITRLSLMQNGGS